MTFRSCALFLLLIAVSGASAREPELPPPPPMALPVNTSGYRGQRMLITLRALGRAPMDLKFLIRSQPRHGALGPITQTGPKSATVTYFHDDAAPGMDGFTFAVQGLDTAVSAAATVKITISEEPPNFEVSRVPDFGSLLLGETREQSVVIGNKGGGVLSGVISTVPPWRIVGDPSYRLGRRGEALVRIAFEPQRAGPFKDPLGFSHDTRPLVVLTGSARAPFSYEPPEVQLGGGDTVKSVRLRIRNLTDKRRTLTFHPPTGIDMARSITVPAEGEGHVTIEVARQLTSGLTGVIAVESASYRTEIPVHVYSGGPSLAAEPAQGIDFGEVPGLDRPSARLVLRNAGGSRAHLRIRVPDDIRIAPDPATLLIEAGHAKEFAISLDPGPLGQFERDLVFESDGTAPLHIPVKWRRIPALRPEDPAVVTTPMPKSSPSAKPQQPTSPVPSAAISEIKLSSVGPHHLEFTWRKPRDGIGQTIEVRRVQIRPKSPPRILWEEWKGVTYTNRDDWTIARIDHLPPGSVWPLRIRPIYVGGLKGTPSATIHAATLNPRQFRIPWWLWLLAVVGVAIVGIRFREQRREQESRENSERLSRIEGR